MSETGNNPNEPDEPTQDTAESAETAEPTLAERKAFKPSGETKADGALNKKGKKAKKEKPEPTTFLGKLWYGWVKPIGSVIIVVIVFRSMLLDWNDVPSGSMEPEIHVGDRVAVNRLAYALQFPLTGPKIGIPFIGPQFDNPLDGIGQIAWGEPERGDIVTFWNPVSDIRMIKRIVAIPGDEIEIRNSKMIINGTEATYQDLDALTEGLPPQTKYKVQNPMGGTKDVYEDLTYQRETILDQERIIQHIEGRWIKDGRILALPNTLAIPTHVIVDRGWMIQNYQRVIKFEDYLARNVTVDNYSYDELATVKEGELFIQGRPASYNDVAKLMLAPYASGEPKESLDEIGLEVRDHELLVDGEVVLMGPFIDAMKERTYQLKKLGRAHMEWLGKSLETLSMLQMTNFGPYTIPADQYFMVGDNRNNSSDGRYFGPVKRGEITGQAFAVAFSFKDNKMFTLPPVPAWDRFFKDLD